MPSRIRAVLVLAALALITGCARHAHSPAGATTLDSPASFDRGHGKAIFVAQCQVCHGAGGVGGTIGPPLRAEHRKHSFDEVIAIVKDPDPPMPRLFPAQMTQRDLIDVSAYVESL
ncbi:MAG: c-type cytochrome [Vulcanimicrobiaceae bacterium]